VRNRSWGRSVTNVIYKSGTNDFHGSAWELNRNSALAAVPAQSGFAGITTNPFDNENTFGFTFGGPIKKDKLFVFGTSQWDRERASAAAQTKYAASSDRLRASLHCNRWAPIRVSIF